MDPTSLALAIPGFYLLIALELVFARVRRRELYRFADSITDLSCGIGSVVFPVFYSSLVLAAYVWIYEVTPLRIPTNSVLAWVGVIFGVDFCYYLFHRAAHRTNFLWAGHIVHHQSEEYNLAVALRQSWFIGALRWVFYIPLVALGFSPLMIIGARTLNTLYQFWIHTRAIGRLGPIEWIFNTPSHHRVHHGINPKYIDKNYAGMFIIWDRLFGTFVREQDEPVYGTVRPLASWNPLWANLAHWVTMARIAGQTRRWADKIRIWFAPPEWRPADLGGVVDIPEVDRASQHKYNPTLRPGLVAYVLCNYALMSAGIAAFLLRQNQLSGLQAIAITVLAVAVVVSWGGLFEARSWAPRVDVYSRVALVGLVFWLLYDSRWLWWGVVTALVLGLAFATWLGRLVRAAS